MSESTMQFALPFQEFPPDVGSNFATEQDAAPSRRKPRRASAIIFDYPPAPDLINMTELTPTQDIAKIIDIIDTTATVTTVEAIETVETEHAPVIQEARLWQDNGWTARVIKNEDDEGWAVAMCKDGESEPALVGPWTMGRDKKNPKPLVAAAFTTLVKTASEVLRRHEQQLHAMLHKSVDLNLGDARWQITLDIVPDEFEPYATLSAEDSAGEVVAQVKVSPNFKLNRQNALKWIENEFRRPE